MIIEKCFPSSTILADTKFFYLKMTIKQTVLHEADVTCGLHSITRFKFTNEYSLLLTVNLDVILKQHSLKSLTCIQSSKDQGDKPLF